MALPRYRVPPSPSLTPTHSSLDTPGSERFTCECPLGEDREGDRGPPLFFYSLSTTVHHPPPTTTHHPPPTTHCPDIHGDNSGTKISNFIKGLQRGKDGQVKYQDVAISSLPLDPSAAGIRHGAADALASSVPAELAVHNTGHDLTGLSALWEYLRARLALCMPGANARPPPRTPSAHHPVT